RKSGIQEFLRNQCNREPDPLVAPKLWHQKPLAGFQFFWADARTERTPRNAATVGSASLLGETQSLDLDKWLADKQVEGARFLFSPAPNLPPLVDARGNPV